MSTYASEQTQASLCGLNLLYIRPGYKGGTVRYAFRLFAELLALDHFDWCVYVRAGVDLPSEFYQPKIRLYVIEIHGSLVGRVAYEQIFLPLRAKKDGVKLLFSPGFITPLWGGFRKIVTIHDLYFKLFPQFVRPWQRLYWKLFIPLSLRVADAVIANSKTTYRDLVKYYPWVEAKSQVIPLGVTSASNLPSALSVQQDVLYCLVVGNLTPNKNIGVVVEAIKRINSNGTQCYLRVVGQDLEGELTRYLKGNGGSELVLLQTGISDDDLWAYYSGALCTIQASIYEGFGLPVLEAMVQGSPVIISDADALLEVAGDAALSFHRNSVDELVFAIMRLLTEDGLCDELRKKGLKRVKKFSWVNNAKKTSHIFKALLNNARLS